MGGMLHLPNRWVNLLQVPAALKHKWASEKEPAKQPCITHGGHPPFVFEDITNITKFGVVVVSHIMMPMDEVCFIIGDKFLHNCKPLEHVPDSTL